MEHRKITTEHRAKAHAEYATIYDLYCRANQALDRDQDTELSQSLRAQADRRFSAWQAEYPHDD